MSYNYIVTTKYSKRRPQLAFSLVEVVIALAVISFACVTLLGLLANGLVTVKNSVNNTVGAEILQSVINNSQINSYSGVATNYPNWTNFIAYDDQGNTLSDSPTFVAAPGAVYFAQVQAKPLNTTPSYTYNITNSGCLLLVAVTNVTAPGTSNVFTLVWANSGK